MNPGYVIILSLFIGAVVGGLTVYAFMCDGKKQLKATELDITELFKKMRKKHE